MFSDTDGIIFDFDGTLVDTIPDLAWAVDQMCMQLGHDAPGVELARTWIGNGAVKLIERALEHACGELPESIDTAKELFLDAYNGHCCVSSFPYPTVMDTLETLHDRGMPMALVTNKPGRFVGGMLEHYGMVRFFGSVVAGDSLPVRKPDPTPLLHAAEMIGCRRGLMVGDSINDVTAARAADMPVVCMSYGYNHGQDIRDADPDAVIDRLEELRPLLP